MSVRDRHNLVHDCIEMLDDGRIRGEFVGVVEARFIARNTNRTITARGRCGVRVKVHARVAKRLDPAAITCLLCWREMFHGP